MDPNTAHVTAIVQRMNAILSEVKDVSRDVAAKNALLAANRELENSLRHPYETISCWAFSPGHLVTLVLAADLGIFDDLAEGPKTLCELATPRNADVELVKQILRTLRSMGFVSSEGQRYIATALTHHIAKASVIAGVRHFFANLPVYHAMPEYFARNGYKLPENSRSGPLQSAYATDKGAYQVWDEMDLIDNFNIFMKGHFAPPSMLSWLDWFRIQDVLDGFALSKSEYMFVDVGGGKGHEGEKLLQRYSTAEAGKFVLQDLSFVLAGIEELDPRIERMEHDFNKSQPIKGARAYFMRDILHNYSDGECLHILTQLKNAMLPGYSKLLICNIILKDGEVSLRQTGLDIGMLALHSGKQRDEGQWRSLLSQSGLNVLAVHHPPGDGDGVIEAEVSV